MALFMAALTQEAALTAVASTVDAPAAPACDLLGKQQCITDRKSLDEDCNTPYHCTSDTDKAVEDEIKQKRCWTDMRQRCTLNELSGESDRNNCWTNQGCTCGRDCIESCNVSKDLNFMTCSERRCGCSNTTYEAAKKMQDDYFNEPLRIWNEQAEMESW